MVASGKAPDFTLADKDDVSVRLHKVAHEYVVLYFYPKDSTSGCTIEAKEFSEMKKTYEEAGIQIIGVSGGDQKTKKKFCDDEKLTITLLSDPDFLVSKSYGVYGPKQFMGKEYMGINRTTFVLDRNKNIVKVYEKVTPAGHAKEVFEWIKKGI